MVPAQVELNDLDYLSPAMMECFRRGCQGLDTPAFVYDEEAITERSAHIRRAANRAGAKLLYSLKPLMFADVLRLIAPYVDGFSTSSLFEASLARSVVPSFGTIHLTTPSLRPEEVSTLSEICNYISFNSLSQWRLHKGSLPSRVKQGLRVNPQQSFVEDPRYDPCAKNSKLGVPLDSMLKALCADSTSWDGLTGLHVHNNCDSLDFGELLTTVIDLENQLDGLLPSLEWVNLGGGYLFDEDSINETQLDEAIGKLRSKYRVEVFLEPGAAIVREAGYLVSTVLDIFQSGDKSIVVLDTSVNHMPEIFEYQFRPDVFGDAEDGAFVYILCGSTCLAGDLFGEYSFTKPLEVGSQVIFIDMGAYTLTKAHSFNGLNLPSIYALTPDADLVLKKQFTLQEFASRWGFTAEHLSMVERN